jgi:hypothetical protein
MLKLASIVGVAAGLERDVQSAGVGVALVTCRVLPDPGLSEKAFHWRLKTNIVPLIDISIGADDGRFRRIKATIMKDVVQVKEDLGPPSNFHRGRPIFETDVWKAESQPNDFAGQFVDESGTLGVKWTSEEDLCLRFGSVLESPTVECEVHTSLSLLFNDRSDLIGVLVRDLSNDERERIDTALAGGTQ